MNRELAFKNLYTFRHNMGLVITTDFEKYIWGDVLYANQDRDNIAYDIRDEKLQIAKRYLKIILLTRVVKFVAVSGSIAAGTVREKDDIDLFIVVKNNTAWFFRGVTFLLLRLRGALRVMSSADVNNKLCINFITEERGLNFVDHDIFILHELFYLITIYNEEYKDFIICKNKWIKEFGINLRRFCSKSKDFQTEPANIMIKVLNKVAFTLQYLYSKLRNTLNDEYYNKVDDYNKFGYIRSYKKNFKEDIMTNLNE